MPNIPAPENVVALLIDVRAKVGEIFGDPDALSYHFMDDPECGSGWECWGEIDIESASYEDTLLKLRRFTHWWIKRTFGGAAYNWLHFDTRYRTPKRLRQQTVVEQFEAMFGKGAANARPD